MITIISILFTIYQASLVTSECPAAREGDACTADPALCDLTQIQCDGEDFNCCPCTSIQCGDRGDSTPTQCVVDGEIDREYCQKFTASGLQAAYSVASITIYGDPDNGASIECNGESSCEKAVITGGSGDGNVKSVKCSGDKACAEATFDFDCLKPADNSQCKVECVGGDQSCYSADFTISNTAGLLCDGTEACAAGSFMFESNVGGSVQCKGERVCAGDPEATHITINDTRAVICDGPSACKGANIVVRNPREDFVLKCRGLESCYNLKLTLIFDKLKDREVSTIKGFDCGDDSACSTAVITVTNDQTIPLVIYQLNCPRPDSCLEAVFIFDGSNEVSTTFEKCVCGEYGGCQSAKGIESCWYNIEKMECKGSGSCEGEERTITNPTDGFELLCPDYRSCADFTLTININDGKHPSKLDLVTDLRGVICSGEESCVGIKVEFVNNHDSAVTVFVDNIVCSGDDSCTSSKSRGAQFITTGDIGDVMFEGIECGVHTVCVDGVCDDVSNCGESIADCSIAEIECNEFVI